eukprot:5580496-Amphidinium_carterae.1
MASQCSKNYIQTHSLNSCRALSNNIGWEWVWASLIALGWSPLCLDRQYFTRLKMCNMKGVPKD